jgi:hypothetical protein
MVRATKDRYGKVYFKLPNGQCVKVKTFHKLYPQMVGLRTAEVIENLKRYPIVEVKI